MSAPQVSLLLSPVLFTLLPLPDVLGQATAPLAGYRSPYSVKFTFDLKDLSGDLQHGPRGEPSQESTIPLPAWYSAEVRKRYGVWGPPARHFPPPDGLARRSLEWKQQRVVAAGLRFLGYGYQHHHVPDWDPPADWPWKPVKSGHNGKGLDCSNFTAFAYNLGLGIKPTGNVKKQAELREVAGPGTQTTRVERIALPATYAALVKTLRTGDLLFIRNKEQEISHVVLWLGPLGQSPDQTPLILDSHGAGVRDADGQTIPDGVRLRPFREASWYYKSSSHALRLLHAD